MAEEFEKRSPIFDWANGEFALDPGGNVLTATQGAAAEQIIIKALQTARGLFLIYANLEDPDLNHKYGSDIPGILRDHTISREVKEDELKRAIKEALVFMGWITAVENIKFTPTPGAPYAVDVDCDVRTVFDDVIEVRGVSVNG